MQTRKINIFSRMFFNFLGADIRLLEQNPEDRPILMSLSLQLVGIFILLFVLQAGAFTVLSSDPYIGVPLGVLTAFLITLTDRVLIGGDWYNEGEYWYHYYQDGDQELLNKLRNMRIFKMILRLILGAVISVSIVSIATPALFQPEIETVLDKLDKKENIEAIKKHNETVGRAKDTYHYAQKERDNLELVLGEKRAALDSLRQRNFSAFGDEQITKLSSEIQSVQEKIQEYTESRSLSLDLREQERAGYAPNDPKYKGIDRTGVQGCGPRCIYHDNEAGKFKTLIEKESKKLASLNKKYEARLKDLESKFAQNEKVISEEIREIEEGYLKAKSQVNSSLDRLEDVHFSENETVEKIGVSFIHAGLKRKVDAYHEVIYGSAEPTNKTESIITTPDTLPATESTLLMLFLLKVFAIFLETIVFTSKMLSSTRAYSVAVYVNSVNKLTEYSIEKKSTKRPIEDRKFVPEEFGLEFQPAV